MTRKQVNQCVRVDRIFQVGKTLSQKAVAMYTGVHICEDYTIISIFLAYVHVNLTIHPSLIDFQYWILMVPLFSPGSDMNHRYLWTGHSIPLFYTLPSFFSFFLSFIYMSVEWCNQKTASLYTYQSTYAIRKRHIIAVLHISKPWKWKKKKEKEKKGG